jgi:two-component system, LuxR family, secretion system response regulator SsrB
MDAPRTTCFVADDHPALLAAVCDLLVEHGFDVVGTAADGRSALTGVTRARPDVVLVDYRMRPPCGAVLVHGLAEAAPATAIVVYTGEAAGELAADALAAGARAIVLKQAPLQDVIRALHAAMAGERYLDPAITLREGVRGSSETLTQREREVLALLAEGHGQREIGERLAIGVETVRTHLNRARARLGATTAANAVAQAIRLEQI